jgi:hypothetical protein
MQVRSAQLVENDPELTLQGPEGCPLAGRSERDNRSASGLRAAVLLMAGRTNLVELAALVGDTARATMLNVLMGGQSSVRSITRTSLDRPFANHTSWRGAVGRHPKLLSSTRPGR